MFLVTLYTCVCVLYEFVTVTYFFTRLLIPRHRNVFINKFDDMFRSLFDFQVFLQELLTVFLVHCS
jgi:hypothetical protein